MKYIIFNGSLWTGSNSYLTEGKKYQVHTNSAVSYIYDDAEYIRNIFHWSGDILDVEDKDDSKTDLSSLEKRLDTLEGLVKDLSSNALKTPKDARQVYTLELTKDELDALFKMTNVDHDMQFSKKDLGIDSYTDYTLYDKIYDLI